MRFTIKVFALLLVAQAAYAQEPMPPIEAAAEELPRQITYCDSPAGSWRLVPVLAGIGCPVLVIHGSEDEYGSEAFPTTIARHVRGPVQVELLDGCGHVPHRERTAPVLDLVSTFIQRHNGAEA